MKIAVVGGGFTGLALSYKLSKLGHQVKLFERDRQLGGLATYHNYGSFIWDKFYHVILPSDIHLISFIHELGLGEKLNWEQTFTGYYHNNTSYSVSNTKEFLRFPLLSYLSKIKLAYTILKASKTKNWQKLETLPLEKWLVNTGGRKNFEKFWKPLLLAKLGKEYKRVSAVFIWTYIKRLFEARDSSAKKEHMGYVNGGYKTIIEAIEQQIEFSGSGIFTHTAVKEILPANGKLKLSHGNKTEQFDKIIFTGPSGLLEKIVNPELFSAGQIKKAVEYLGVICLILITKKPVTRFYVLNIADEKSPFTGVIGLSTIVNTSQTNGNYVTYFPKYLHSTDPILQKSDEEIINTFLKGIKNMFNDIREDDIVDIYVNRATRVQPLQVINYSKIIPSVKSKHPDFYILNTSQLVNDTLNNNAVVKHVEQFINDEGVFSDKSEGE